MIDMSWVHVTKAFFDNPTVGRFWTSSEVFRHPQESWGMFELSLKNLTPITQKKLAGIKILPIIIT